MSEVRSGYRPDIDGLRAVAVGLVVLYHAFPAWLPGGFVGVDIFFVISGFLITGILSKELERGDFSLARFYERRVRRIFPALGLVLAVVLACGWFWSFPDELKNTGKHVLAGAGFVSNLVYWQEFGYFDHAAETKPLLHLWSLAVEEQFYIVWPLLLAALVGRPGLMRWVLVVLTVLSFFWSVRLAGSDSAAAYYSPLSRFWQIAAGALLALNVRQAQPLLAHGAWRLLPSALVIVGLVASLCFIHKFRPYPGYWALLPTLAACAVVMPQVGRSPLARVLGAKPLVWVGLVSYPLYLWHWPVLVLMDIELAAWPELPRRALAVAMSVALAWATYRWVETPLRGRSSLRTPRLLTAGMVVLALVGAFFWWADGVPARVSGVQFAQRQAMVEADHWQSTDEPCLQQMGLAPLVKAGQQVFCRMDRPEAAERVALLGDSTANALFPGVQALTARQGLGLINVGNGACPPLWGVQGRESWNRACETINRQAQALVKDPRIKVVVLSLAPWDKARVDMSAAGLDEEQAARSLLRGAVDSLLAMGKRVVLVYDIPNFGMEPGRCATRLTGLAPPACLVSESELKDRHPAIDFWRRVAQDLPAPVCVFSQTDALRRTDGRFHPLDDEGLPLVRDTHHLSLRGSARVAQALDRACGLTSAPHAPMAQRPTP